MLCLNLNSRYILIYQKLLKALPSLTQRSYSTPLAALRQKISNGEFMEDQYQLKAVNVLESLHQKLQSYTPGSGGNAPNGVYLYGSVGRGKTAVMDLFYESCTHVSRKKRLHFNSFMSKVHSQIHVAKSKLEPSSFKLRSKEKPFDVTKIVANEIAEESYLICFDEFQVTDIADAMILKGLFTNLFDQGIVMVATSNRHPNDLYKNGLNRSNFVPFIGLLQQKCDLVSMESNVDYRMARGGQKGGYFFVKSQSNANSELDRIFKQLCAQENDMIRPRTITHLGRDLVFAKTCGQVLDSTFNELCDRPLAGSDYIQASQFFHTVLIRDVPQLNLSKTTQVRRFITLIDTLYDNRVRVVISCDVPLQQLFDKNFDPNRMNDNNRKLMDDLDINVGSEEASANVFSGQEEFFAFDRTLSRLHEMQTQEYWAQWEKHR